MSDVSPFLRVTMKHRQGSLGLDLRFDLTAPWTVLFGPSGSGKSTVLRSVQGLVRPFRGRIELHGRALLDRDSRINVVAHRRAVRSAPQTSALFPHMTVRQNVAWGCTDERTVDTVLRLFQVDPLAAQVPRALSGGERQRVSVARAVASAADLPGALLLLDEPFTGLDLDLRDRLAVELREWLPQRGVPVLSVTHDVAEAFLLRAEVLRLEDGRIVAQGPPQQVLARERDRLLDQLS